MAVYVSDVSIVSIAHVQVEARKRVHMLLAVISFEVQLQALLTLGLTSD